jgi:hypothetical protein
MQLGKIGRSGWLVYAAHSVRAGYPRKTDRAAVG